MSYIDPQDANAIAEEHGGRAAFMSVPETEDTLAPVIFRRLELPGGDPFVLVLELCVMEPEGPEPIRFRIVADDFEWALNHPMKADA